MSKTRSDAQNSLPSIYTTANWLVVECIWTSKSTEEGNPNLVFISITLEILLALHVIFNKIEQLTKRDDNVKFKIRSDSVINTYNEEILNFYAFSAK